MPHNKLSLHKETMKLMGNRFEITVVAADAAWASACIAAAVAEIQRIEQLLSTYIETSATNQINAAAGLRPVQVSTEVIQLIQRAQHISSLTQGAFDLSYGSVDKRFWNFDQSMTRLPDAATAQASVRLINYKHIIVDAQAATVMLKEPGMRIGFGGIGKGYAADKAKQVLQDLGVESGIVNASGDLVTWGKQADGSAWTVGVAHPDRADLPFSKLELNNMAIATSGNYEKFVVIDGVKYSHTIDPHTGYPIQGIKSVTVICPHAELADALTTPISIMGLSAGMYMVNQLKGVACIIIDDENKIYTTDNIHLI